MHFLLIGYMFLFIDRPFEVWPFLGDIHLERLYMLMTLLVWAMYPDKRWLPNGLHFAFLAFAVAVAFCWGMSPWMDQGQRVVENYFKVVVFYVLLVTSVNNEKALKQIVAGLLVVMALYLLHSLKEYIGGRHTFRMGIVRMIGVDSSAGDPNSFGATIVLVLPFVAVFWGGASRNVRRLLLGYVGLSVLCVLLTGSRSALLSMMLVGLVMCARWKRTWKWLFLGAAASPIVFLALPGSLQNRFETIVNPEVGPENAQVSAEGRLEGLFTGLKLIQEYPATGVGPGAWRPATHSELESHNLYGQVMGEMGLPGVLALGFVVFMAWRNLREVRRLERHNAPDNSFLSSLNRAIGLSLFMLLFEGNFGHNLFRYTWLWYGGFLIIAAHCARTRPAVAPAYVPRRVPLPWALPAT